MTLKIGLIGCGGIMRAHVSGWNRIKDQAKIVAIADLSQEATNQRAAQIGHAVDVYQDYNTLLAREDIDAVDIGLPHHLHRDSIVAAADAGKHVMSEKPLCLTLDEAADIAAAVERNGVKMMAGHNQLFFPAVLQAKQMIMAGELGQIYQIHSIDCGARRKPLSLDKSRWGESTKSEMRGWRKDPAKMGGGELIDTGYHPTYRLLFLAGKKPEKVTAMLGNHRLDMEQEDTADVLVQFEKGTTGKIFSSWALRATGARPTLFNVMGEAGQLWGEADRLYYQPVGFETPAVATFDGWTGLDTFAAEIAHFVDAIVNDYEPLHSVTEATETLRVILGAYESVREDRIVTL